MEPTPDKRFSFPNADQPITGVTDASRPQPEEAAPTRRPTVNIFEALKSEKRGEENTENMRTYQEDIASAIRNDNVSMIKVALAEKKRQERQGTAIDLEEKDPTKKYIMFGVIIVVVIIFIAGISLFVFNSLSATDAPAGQTVFAPLLYTEKRIAISIDDRDNDDITRLLKRELNDPELSLGQMKGIVLVSGTGTSTREVSTSDLFKQLQSRAPDSLIRALSARFMLGVYSFSPNDFFMLVPVESYDVAFAGMLQWEPDIENDIGNFMITKRSVVPIVVSTLPRAGSTSTAGLAVKESLGPATATQNKTWVDRVINNKDVRLLVDSDGTPAMLYAFLDKETLVIASSDKALKEVTFRLTAGRIVR